MHAIVRTYSGTNAKNHFDLFAKRKAEIESVIKSVPGVVSYLMVGTGTGGVTVTVCNDKARTDESLRVARDWVQKNAAEIGATPPDVVEGVVFVQIK